MADNQTRARWGGYLPCRRPLALAAFSILLPAFIGGGCHGPQKSSSAIIEKYFPEGDPESCLVGFVFALENRNWDGAYSRLSSNTMEKVGRFKFKFGLPLIKDPKTGISVLKIITDSITDRTFLKRAPGQPKDIERIRLNYIGKDTKGRVAAYIVTVYLHDERPQDAETAVWRIDLVRTAETLSGPKA